MPETHDGERDLDLTVVLPAYNEERAIVPLVEEIRRALANWPGWFEILVVDDGSTDHTVERAQGMNVRVTRRGVHRGAGAARKTGISNSRGQLIAMLDADGSYAPADLPRLLDAQAQYDLVQGARTSELGSLRPLRVVAKWLIRKLAECMTGHCIPDLNTGMKVFQRDLMLRYLARIPDGFSCVTTMTLLFLSHGHRVGYVTIEYRPRVGRSKFRPVRDTARYVATVLRLARRSRMEPAVSRERD